MQIYELYKLVKFHVQVFTLCTIDFFKKNTKI